MSGFQAGLYADPLGNPALQARVTPCDAIYSSVEQKPAGSLSGRLNA